MATNYDINYDDSRFQKVESQKSDALDELSETYDGMIKESDSYFQKQIDEVGKYKDTQTKLQNEQTQLTIDQINQQKDQAKKDYTKEQSGAYVDWQKQSNQYGANAEEMAASGLSDTGFSESSQVSMYNTYQNRVATAREAYNRAVLNYDNSIKEAKLQNSTVLAEIAYNALQKQLELSLQGFQYKNQLVLDKADKKMQIDSEYYNRYQDVLQQINTENALAEEVRQYNETLALEKAQFDWQKEQAKKQAATIKSSSSGSSGYKAVTKKTSNTGASSGTAGIVKSGQATQVSQHEVSNKNSSNSVTIDMSSVLALGYGPISEARLSQLVDQGLVEQYRDGNKIKFRKSATFNKLKRLQG